MGTVSVSPPACANWISGATICPGGGKFACAHCKLVVVRKPSYLVQCNVSFSNKVIQYCGATCQKNHWLAHKKVCKSSLSKTSWRPQWDLEEREPAWASGPASQNWHNPYGETKYLWGNVPAIDVLKLKQNEGQGYQQRLSLLFAGTSRPSTSLDLDYTSEISQRLETYGML